MSYALINNTKRCPYETAPEYKHTPQRTPTSRPFPDSSLLDVLKGHENSAPSQRFSLASRTRLSLKRKIKPSIGFCELPYAWHVGSGKGGEDGDGDVCSAVKEEVVALVEALRNDVKSEGRSCSACVENSDLGYRIIVRVQTREGVKTVGWGRKEVLAVCVVVEGGDGDGNETEKRVVFGCGKATSVAWFGGWVGVRWAVDLRGDGRAERRGVVGRMLACKRGLGKRERVVVGLYDEKMPLLK